MALKKRSGVFYAYFDPFKTGKQIGLKLDAKTKSEAKQIETLILRACRTGDYSILDGVSREACTRMFENQAWKFPSDLGDKRSRPAEGLTLWKAVQLCLTDPEMRNSANRERHEYAFSHVVAHWGKDFPVTEIWIPQIKQYQIERLHEGAAASTIGKERAALSRMFQVLIEMGVTDRNPVRMVRGPSDRDGRREVYVSFKDFQEILATLPAWAKPILETLYYSGMRRGEALGLTWENVNLDSRIIRLYARQTKERQTKRIPIHVDLLPIFEAAKKIRSISSDRVFLIEGGRPPCEDSLRKPWTFAVKAAALDPPPTMHDLRHVWKTNAVRSGMDFEMREAIMGHSRGIAGRYGRFSDQDLIRAIDGMSYDKGETEIWIARRNKENPEVTASGSKTEHFLNNGHHAQDLRTRAIL